MLNLKKLHCCLYLVIFHHIDAIWAYKAYVHVYYAYAYVLYAYVSFLGPSENEQKNKKKESGGKCPGNVQEISWTLPGNTLEL